MTYLQRKMSAKNSQNQNEPSSALLEDSENKGEQEETKDVGK